MRVLLANGKWLEAPDANPSDGDIVSIKMSGADVRVTRAEFEAMIGSDFGEQSRSVLPKQSHLESACAIDAGPPFKPHQRPALVADL